MENCIAGPARIGECERNDSGKLGNARVSRAVRVVSARTRLTNFFRAKIEGNTSVRRDAKHHTRRPFVPYESTFAATLCRRSTTILSGIRGGRWWRLADLE